jgi:hypothetical protein
VRTDRRPIIEYIQTSRDIRLSLARTAQQIALAQQCGKTRTHRERSALTGFQQHSSETGVHRPFSNFSSALGDLIVICQQVETTQKVTGRREHGGWRCIQPSKRMDSYSTPLGKLERKRGKIRLENFRIRLRSETAVCPLAPKPETMPCGHTTCSTGALLGGSAGDPTGLKTTHSGDRIKD